MCQENMCNDFDLTLNATTPAPSNMSTAAGTMLCYYGLQRNSSVHEDWQTEICGPQETACLLISNDAGFKMASCYDFR